MGKNYENQSKQKCHFVFCQHNPVQVKKKSLCISFKKKCYRLPPTLVTSDIYSDYKNKKICRSSSNESNDDSQHDRKECHCFKIIHVPKKQ